MYQKLFYRLLAVLLLASGMTGCASYRDLPSGTHQRVSARQATTNQDSAVVREVIDLSSNPDSSNVPYRPGDYIVGPNDVLFVSVNGKIDFGSYSSAPLGSSATAAIIKGYRVDGLGFIYIPLAGRISVAGISIAEARQRIQTALGRYYNDPSIVVEISEYRTRQVFIFGAVRKPGAVPMPTSGINLAQLMSSADVNEAGGNFRQVRIIRSNSPTQGELLVVDFDKMLQGQSVPLQLQEGDIVYVPKSAIGSWNEVISEILPSLQAVSATLQPFVNIKYLKQ